jgi:hypothetical protein
VLVAVDGGPFLPWQVGTTATSAAFTGQPGRTYAYASLARDGAGHVEAPPATPDAITTVAATTTIASVADRTSAEGQLLVLVALPFTTNLDPSGLVLTIDWGDGTSGAGTVTPGTGGGTLTGSHTYADSGTRTVTLTLSTGTGVAARASFAVAVANAPPTATPVAAAPVREGSTGRVSLTSATDPSAADLAAGLRYSFDFNGDGKFDVTNSTLPSATVPATYLADGPATRTVRARVVDKDGGFTDYTIPVAEANVTPTVALRGKPAPILQGGTMTLGGAFADPGADTWKATVDYGDGTKLTPLTLKADRSFALAHKYTRTGSFLVTVRVTDEDGGTGLATFTVMVQPPPVRITQVKLISRNGYVSGIVLVLTAPINPAAVPTLNLYRLATAGRDKKYGTKDEGVTALKSAVYAASTRTITLTPRTPFRVSTTANRLTVNGSKLLDQFRRPVDGNRDSKPGGTITADLTSRGVTIR